MNADDLEALRVAARALIETREAHYRAIEAHNHAVDASAGYPGRDRLWNERCEARAARNRAANAFQSLATPEVVLYLAERHRPEPAGPTHAPCPFCKKVLPLSDARRQRGSEIPYCADCHSKHY